MKMQRKKTNGFTLLEAMLVIAVFAVLAGLSAPLVVAFLNRTDVNMAASHTVHSLRRAQMLAQMGEEDGQWGVYVDSGSITVYKGANYAGRDPAFDELFTVSGAVQFSGDNEYTFNTVTGYPAAAGTTTISDDHGALFTIDVTTEGSVLY